MHIDAILDTVVTSFPAKNSDPSRKKAEEGKTENIINEVDRTEARGHPEGDKIDDSTHPLARKRRGATPKISSRK
jgi:hypothetical protein